MSRGVLNQRQFPEDSGFSVEDNTLHLHGEPFRMAQPSYEPEPIEGEHKVWHGWSVPLEGGNRFHIAGQFEHGRASSGKYGLHTAVHKGDDPEHTGNVEPWSPVHSPEHLKKKLIEASKHPGSGKGRRVAP
jgi:hypothetical protein